MAKAENFYLSATQRDIWLAQSKYPESAQFQCAELIHFPGELDRELLRECILHCLRQIPVVCADYGSAVYDSADYGSAEQARYTPEAGIPVHLVASEHNYGEELFRWASRTVTVPGTAPLTEHYLLQLVDGTTAWLARFHHLTGDGYSIHRILDFICQTYTRRVAGQPDPASPFAPAAEYARPAEFTPSASTEQSAMMLGILQDRAVHHSAVHHRAALDGNTLGSDEVVVTGHARVSTAGSVINTVAQYCASMANSAEIVLGFPQLNRPMGQTAVDMRPQVSIKTRRYDAHQDEFTDVNCSGCCPHINLRPFSAQFCCGNLVGSMRTISAGPIDDIEIIVQSCPDGQRDIFVMARGSNLQKIVDDHAARLAHAIDNPGEPDFLLPAERSELASFQGMQHRIAMPTLGENLATVLSGTRKTLVRTKTTQLDTVQLGEKISGLAAALRAAGVQPGQAVVVHLERGVDFIVAVGAVISVGGVFVPIDPQLPVERRQAMAQTAQAQVQIGGPSVGCMVVSPQQPPHAPVAPATRQPDDAAYIIFTSGSTGTPKAVVNTHAGITNRLAWMAAKYGLNSDDVVLHKTPSSFDVSIWEYLYPLTYGMCAWLLEPGEHTDPQAVQAALHRSRATLCHFVPSALKGYLSLHDPQVQIYLRNVMVSGEALPAGVAQSARKQLAARVHNLYGPAEAAIDVTAHTVSDEDTQFVPIGAPVWNTKIFITDFRGRQLPKGFGGRLIIGGVQVAQGYKGLASPAFSNGTYDTGDHAVWLADGELHYLGRKDSQVKLRGQRLELGEVEAVLQQHPAVAQAVAVIREYRGQPALIAYVVAADLRDNQVESRGESQGEGQAGDISAAELVAEVSALCRTRLPAYMVPSHISRIAVIPTTINGKLDHGRLPDPNHHSQGQQAEPLLDTGEEVQIDEPVLRAFSQVLDTPISDVHTHFFEAGGNSLSAIQLAKLLNLRVADVFANPTPAQLAQVRRADGFAEFLWLREPKESTELIVCFYPAGGLGWAYFPLASVVQHDSRGIVCVQSTQPDATVQEKTSRVLAFLREHKATRVHLVGWSVGGVVAQDCAVALQDSGIAVAGVVLLDAYPSEVWKQLPAPTRQELLQGVCDMAGVNAEVVTTSDVLRALQDSAGVFGQLSEEEVGTIITMVQHNSTEMRNHTTRYYDGTVHCLVAGDECDVRSELLVASAWEPHCEHVVEHVVATTHPGMVAPKVLRVAAQLLSSERPKREGDFQ